MNTFLTFLVVFVLAWPLGLYTARFMRGERTLLDFLAPVERAFYRLMGVRFVPGGEAQGMDWRGYARALLFSNLLVGLVAFLIYVFQGALPLNPDHVGNLPWYVALNTAASFITNTNWQNYSGQSQLSYLSQMVGITALQIMTPAAGMAAMFALLRGLMGGQHGQPGNLGNYFVDITRYWVPGRRLIDALIDLPFALPTAVAGITLTALLAPNGWIGQLLAQHDLRVVYTRTGIVIALIFIGLPFVVRSLQPVLEDLGHEQEEAAWSLGASPVQTFMRVILPELLPALLSGFTLALARTVGEYGSVVFISGNLPFKTEIAPLLIVSKLEQYNYAGAAAVAVVMLLVSVTLLLVANTVQARLVRRSGTAV